MSITQGVLTQSHKSEGHVKVMDNNQDQIGIWKKIRVNYLAMSQN